MKFLKAVTKTPCFIPYFLMLTGLLASCQPEDFTTSPVLSPDQSLKKMHVEDGFEVELVAAEPLVNSPIAMTFDDKGRIWLLEMESYMLDTLGTGEDKPTGKIVILTDKDKDGEFDDRKIFMDSLVLPRAISFIDDGMLIAEPPNLWYVEIKNDRPGKKELVDSKYAIGGNVEHQPNALYRALDNWVYNAKSDKRYRRIDGQWHIEKTTFRGQWGISQDNYGRLYYNHNSTNLLGDYFSPGFGATNANQRKVAGYYENIVPDNRVYPARPTPGVNRGYMEGILDDSLRLVNFTAASGPTIYRGDLFGEEYRFNAFVAEPAANLIKRDILVEKGYRVEGKQAYQGKEFLTSVDERFRPVSLYNSPDGALYVVDMYRGIIQHKTYATDYLKAQIASRQLSQPHDYGRIYRIVPKGKEVMIKPMPQDIQGLVQGLQDPNGWIRDKAQQMLIDHRMVAAEPMLREYIKNPDKPLACMHALWTMEGLGLLQPTDVYPLLEDTDWHIRVQALSVMPSLMDKDTYGNFLPFLEGMLARKDSLAAPYLAFLAGAIRPYDEGAAHDLLRGLARVFPNNVYVADAILTNLQGLEAAFMNELLVDIPDTATLVHRQFRKVITSIEKAKKDKNTAKATADYPKGAAIFKSTCATCHGADGYGIEGLAPPLNNSDWVIGEKKRLIPIVLYGLTGPIIVNKKVYQAPQVTGDMPGIGQNNEFSDSDIADVLSFIRNAWSNRAPKVTAEEIVHTREKFKDREKTFTMEELQAIQ